jgi:hypothetical protein
MQRISREELEAEVKRAEQERGWKTYNELRHVLEAEKLESLADGPYYIKVTGRFDNAW